MQTYRPSDRSAFIPYQRPICSMPSLHARNHFVRHSLTVLPVEHREDYRPNYASTPDMIPRCTLKQAKPRKLHLPPSIMRQSSDKTAVASAAHALLSLTPPLNSTSVPYLSLEVPPDENLSHSKLQHQQKYNSHLLDQEASNRGIRIPDLIYDFRHPTANTTSFDKQDHHGSCFVGSTSLALPEDEEFLSPMHCFMRKYCVEAFAHETTVGHDATRTKYCRRIQHGQVGIRCLFCKNQQHSKSVERGVCFPSSLPNIYHSIETWQRRHARACPHTPEWIKRELNQLKRQSRSGAGGRRHYWVTSAQLLGIVATEHGLRFSHPPGVLIRDDLSIFQQPRVDEESIQESTESFESSSPQSSTSSLVKSEERCMVTASLFLLMEQIEVCHFTEEDRQGTRSKNNHEHALGYSGIQCRHCRGKAGCGRYFPATLRALTSANSDRNLWNHLQKCRKCPDRVREQINELQLQSLNEKNRRGSRKQFFLNIWQRIHTTESMEYVS